MHLSQHLFSLLCRTESKRGIYIEFKVFKRRSLGHSVRADPPQITSSNQKEERAHTQNNIACTDNLLLGLLNNCFYRTSKHEF